MSALSESRFRGTAQVTVPDGAADAESPKHFVPRPDGPAPAPTASTSAGVEPPAPAVDISQPLQVWAGPLAGGDVAVLLLNIGSGTKKITASWDDIGLKSGVSAMATDLWTGENLTAVGSISASVASHASAVYRLVQG